MEGLFATIGALFLTGFLGLKLLMYLCPWLASDLQLLTLMIGSQISNIRYAKQDPQFTTVQRLIELAREKPEKDFVLFEDQKWTYRDINCYSNQVARVLHDVGIRINDTVALMMTGRPEMIGIWFGIAKTAAITAFINYNHRKKSLLNLLLVSKSKLLIIPNEKEILEAIEEIAEELNQEGIKIFVLGEVEDGVKIEHRSLHTLIESASSEEVPVDWRKDVTLLSHFAYIYTSGTTGLPKASIMKHTRSWLLGKAIAFVGAGEDDVIYTPLPLYHTAGLFGVLGALDRGCTVVIRHKFSASHFWEDCRKYKATIIQYIGETLRYVCNQPAHEDDKNHCIRAAIGNGLRPLVWRNFLDRFGKQIKVVEFYATTEGNCGFFNLDNHVGSVGFFSPLMKSFATLKLVQYDRENDEIVRDSNGRCIEVPTGTPGLLISLITKYSDFHGYLGNKTQTEKKIVRNVVKDGDAYFNTGDLLRRDHDYHMHFVDRLGDTFRWKGENVSTNEVADIMSSAPSIKETNVYGVEIPGTEGRAGMMVAILEDGMEFDGPGIYHHACECLASYARPIFIRVKEEMQTTGTFKYIKVKLVEEGFEPSKMGGDQVYFMSNEHKSYIPLTGENLDDVINECIKL